MIGASEDDKEPPWLPMSEMDGDALEPPGSRRRSRPAAAPYSDHPLLAPLARAQDAVARLEARAEAASPAVAEGLRARTAYREAAGWLTHTHIWIHPRDLALRDGGLTGSYSTAAMVGRLEAELPSTAAQGSFDVPPSDLSVDQALRLARLWRRLAEFRTWKPLADSASLRDVLESLGYREPSDDVTIEDWLASVQIREHGPPLIRAGRTARDWLNRRQATDSLSPDGIFLAACLWRQSGFGRAISLPFWSAPTQRHHRLTLQVGQGWLAEFLDCVAEAARMAAGELTRLQQVEENGRRLARTARSRLPAALNSVLRAPIVTVRDLAKDLDVTPQAALSLLRQLLDAEIVREATGRASWRAFATF